jgi:hypothetical protein
MKIRSKSDGLRIVIQRKLWYNQTYETIFLRTSISICRGTDADDPVPGGEAGVSERETGRAADGNPPP